MHRRSHQTTHSGIDIPPNYLARTKPYASYVDNNHHVANKDMRGVLVRI
jgi:hypothetical protein